MRYGLVLGNPFLTQIQPITVNNEGISGMINNVNVNFKFTVPTQEAAIGQVTVEVLSKEKERYEEIIASIKREVPYARITSQLQNTNILI